MKKNKLLDMLMNQFAECLWSVNTGGTGARWPMPLVRDTSEPSIYCDPFVIDELRDRIHKLKQTGLKDKDIAHLFKYPSIPARLVFLFRSRKFSNLSKEELVKLAEGIATYCYLLYRRDNFCQNKSNILLDKRELNRELKPKFTKATPETKHLLGQIDGKLWLYTELVFPRWHNLGHEFHGPYHYKGKRLLIKEWHDLNSDMWGWSKKFPYSKITSYELYQGAKVKLDIHNRLFSDQPLINHVTHFYIKKDGRIINQPHHLEELNQLLDTYIRRATKIISRLDKRGVIKKNAEMEFYTIKPLADKLGVSWKPPRKCYLRAKNCRLTQAEKDYIHKFRSVFQDKKTIKNIYDPRREFS